MSISRLVLIILTITLILTPFACDDSEGEESVPYLGKDEVCDAVRKGVRLILEYDSTTTSFIGMVENVTSDTIKDI